MRQVLFSLFIGLICLSSTSYGEKAPIKFGSVSREELTMKVYEYDTSAPAVILCDYGILNTNDFVFTRITRIKILKKSGYDWANKVFPPYNNASVKGITYNLENGEIAETKLESGAIHEEVISGNMKRLRIAMPNVTVGSVIDLKFVFTGIPFVWEFQQEIPVLHSELVLDDNPFVSFRKNLSGFIPLTQNEDGHWIAKKMPAFKAEPFISSPKNYMTRIEFDILEIRFRTYYEAFTTNWQDLCNHLRESEYFGVPLENASYMNTTAKDISAKTGNDKEKLRMAHEFIKNYKWNKYESLYTSESHIKWALDKQSGNSADINLALVQLLGKLGFEVSPVMLSTRDNGFLSRFTPSLNKLNYVIASVNLNGEQILMDATEQNAPYDLLPERALNFTGRLYNKELSVDVDLKPVKKEKELVIYNLTLDDELQLKGSLDFRRQDYAALDFRNKFREFSGNDAYLEAFLMQFPGLRIHKATISNIDSLYLPVMDKYEISLNNTIDEVNGNLYIFPMLLHRLKENPFKVDERQYPVDFIHKREEVYSVTINLPENFEVTTYPEALKMMMPDNEANFLYQVTVFDKMIQLNFKLAINKIIFTEDQYKDLREFYNQIIAKHAEPIIIKRKQN